jgi:hypothetical protein
MTSLPLRLLTIGFCSMTIDAQPLQIRGIVGTTLGERNAMVDLPITNPLTDAAGVAIAGGYARVALL